MKISNQWNQIIYLENLPLEWSINQIKDIIKNIIEDGKGRILHPKCDIIIPTL